MGTPARRKGQYEPQRNNPTIEIDENGYRSYSFTTPSKPDSQAAQSCLDYLEELESEFKSINTRRSQCRWALVEAITGFGYKDVIDIAGHPYRIDEITKGLKATDPYCLTLVPLYLTSEDENGFHKAKSTSKVTVTLGEFVKAGYKLTRTYIYARPES